ncbi:MAG: BrnA antitoxin family protein [Spirochaetia bacterium]|nr:BrnA antitoxin family protein [Spirochaetia bacterium]
MRKTIKDNIYENAPKEISQAIFESKKIKDFLPSPEKLVLKEKTVKITLNLNKDSVDFFKSKAKKMGVPYQTMIKKLLDIYANTFHKNNA